MAGFKSFREFNNALDNGQGHLLHFTKSLPASQNTSVSIWRDFSGGVGPASPPNYFASSPGVAATLANPAGLNTEGLVFIPQTSAGSSHYIRKITAMTFATSVTTAQLQQSTFWLMDYLLYYPFVDLTVTDLQPFTNIVTLPRYVTGEGTRILWIMQSGGGTSAPSVTINYTNQAGVSKSVLVEPSQSSVIAGEIVGPTTRSANTAFNSNLSLTQLFVPLASGDTGVRSIESVQLSSDFGGIAAFVIVKPIAQFHVAQESRVNSNISYGAASELEFVRMRAGLAKFEDNPFLMLVGRHVSGASSQNALVIGTIETIWN